MDRAGTPPPGLTFSVLASWMYGNVATARKEHLEFVLSEWARLAERPELVTLTPEIMDTLKAYRDLDGLFPSRVVSGRNIPRGLHPAKVSAWLSGQRTAKREHLEFVLARCREIWGEPFELSEINLSFACMEVICLQTEAFYALVEEVVDRVAEKHADKPDKWVGPEEAMRILRIKAKSTLQALRDEGKIRYSHPQKRIILYDRDSLLAYLEKNARETF